MRRRRRARGNDLVEDVDVVHFADAENAPRTSNSVCIYRRQPCARRNLAQGNSERLQVDGGRVQSVEGLIEIHADRMAGVPARCESRPGRNQHKSASRATRWRRPSSVRSCAESHVVELGAERTARQAVDIAEAFAKGQLGERHAEELIPIW